MSDDDLDDRLERVERLRDELQNDLERARERWRRREPDYARAFEEQEAEQDALAKRAAFVVLPGRRAAKESPRRIYFVGGQGLEVDVPADLRDGEVVEAVQVGGPRDGDAVGRFRVERTGDEVALTPIDEATGGETS